MVKSYLTWGIGYGKSRELAEINAQADANLDKIKIGKLTRLEIPKCEVVENKKALRELKGSFFGIVLQNCKKGEVAASLVLSVMGEKIIIGHGKAGGLVKAEREAEFEVKKAAKEQNLTSDGIDYHIAADAPAKKDTFGCAIVALILVE